jgi:hypothetical protein
MYKLNNLGENDMYTFNNHNNPANTNKIETHLEAMERLGADGIDFVPIFSKSEVCTIYASYTKEQFATVTLYPRSAYRFWKMIDGKKVYIDYKTGEPMNFETEVAISTPETVIVSDEKVSTRERIAIDFINLDADGIDFVSLNFNPMNISQRDIYESYTKKEFSRIVAIPKSPYVFWKMIDGVKVYLIKSIMNN